MQNCVFFLCSSDNLLQKNVIVFFFGNQISKWRSFEKRAILTHFSHFLVTREKLQKFLQHKSHSHTYWLFLSYQFWRKKYEFIRYGFSLVWFLVLILIRAILEQSINNIMMSKINLSWNVFYWYVFTLMPKFIVICKPRTLNDGRWRLSSIQKPQKALLLKSSHFAFYW